MDPIGFNAGDANLFAYVSNDPLNWTDPTGRMASASLGRTTAIGAASTAHSFTKVATGTTLAVASILAVYNEIGNNLDGKSPSSTGDNAGTGGGSCGPGGGGGGDDWFRKALNKLKAYQSAVSNGAIVMVLAIWPTSDAGKIARDIGKNRQRSHERIEQIYRDRSERSSKERTGGEGDDDDDGKSC